MMNMTRFLRRIFGFETELDRKVQDGIDFTIRNYGETLKDLARYDKGEPLSSPRHERAERIGR